MTELILFNKPYRVLCQFSDAKEPDNEKNSVEKKRTLANFIDIPDVYPAGRLDYDSEGLMILTADGKAQHAISHPQEKMIKTYVVQVEGIARREHLVKLLNGVKVQNYIARAVTVEMLAGKPGYLWKRSPPIRHRKNSPTSWLKIQLDSGKNRQVRRMCAAAGLPVLRLIRTEIGPWSIKQLQPGDFVQVPWDGVAIKKI